MSEHGKTTAEGQLARVIYRSHSLLPDAADDRIPAMIEILRIARHRNAQTGLTGVLVFDGTNFLQAIEGEIGQVESLYESISCDLRHEDIELIEFKPIAARDYRNFPMAYIEGLAAERDTLAHLFSAPITARGAEPEGSAVSHIQ